MSYNCGLNEFELALRLSRSKGVGAALFKQLLDKYKLPSLAYEAFSKDFPAEEKLLAVSKKKNTTQEQISETIRILQKDQYFAYYYGQEGYPSQLKDLSEPSPVIYSTASLSQRKYVAIVGSRECGLEQIELAKKVTTKYVEEGYGIVSGGAMGIDSIALKTALASGAYPLAVFATGINVFYPQENVELFQRIVEKGAIISEMMFGAKPQRSFFPTRNRLIAALADVVVAIPSSEKSGALITAKVARKLGRKVYILTS